MEFIEIGKLSIAPFEVEQILELKMEKKLNDHAVLYLHGIIKDDFKETTVTKVSQDTRITLKYDNKTIFCGVIKDINVTCVDAVYYLKATAISTTVLIDVKPMKRSFQEKGKDYKDIANEITKEQKTSITYNSPTKKVEDIILQYSETDWEFIKRLASHSNNVIIPVANSETPKFIFGVEEGGEYREKLEMLNYTVSKDMSMYRTLSQSKELNFKEDDAVIYKVKTNHFVFDIGDKLGLNDKPLFISNAVLRLKNSVLSCTYLLVTKTAIASEKIHNKHIVGLTLSGKVLKVENDKVKVQLSVDEKQEESKAYSFSYATPYTAEGHTGWYVMPEIGDTVQIIFPTEEESKAYATAAIRQKDSDKTTDPKTKYLRTPAGKEIKLNGEEILITAKDGTTFIKINENSGIEIKTDKPISVTSGANISMNSASDFSINSGKKLTITAKEAIEMTCVDNKVKLETPSTGIEITAKKPIKVTGEDNINISSKKKLTETATEDIKISTDKKLDITAKEMVEIECKENNIKLESGSEGILLDSKKPIKLTTGREIDIISEKDLTLNSEKEVKISAGTNLSAHAESEVKIVCRGSSVKLDGNIDLKAKLIKEN